MRILSVFSFIFLSNSNSQNIVSVDNSIYPESNNKITVSNSDNQVVINFDMIERFNSVGKDSEYLTWRDLILGYDVQSLKDFYYAYIKCDFEKESLKDIKLALEQKKLENEKTIRECQDEYFARFKNLKIRINIPDNSDMVVQKINK